jgi:hypothetical protein
MQDLIGVNLTSVRTEAEGPEFAVGTIGCVTTLSEDNGTLVKGYKYVQFNNGAGDVASVAGNFAYYYAVSGASAGQSSIVTMDVTDSGGIGAGVFQAVIANLGYGWIQITGVATLTTALTAGADGNALTAVGTTDGTLDVSAAVTDYICAVAIDASAKIVFLTCPQ